MRDLFTPKERAAMQQLTEHSEVSVATPHTPSPVNAMLWAVVASVVSAAVVGLGVAVLMSWRSEPLTTTTLTKIDVRLDKVEIQMAEHAKIQAQAASDIRANRGEIDGLKAIVSDIKTYQYRTSEEMKKISEDLARIGGWITRGQSKPKDETP